MWPTSIKHYLKTIGGKEYWYLQDTIRVNRRLKPVSIYVAPKEAPEEELQEAIKLALQKLTNKINEANFNESKRKYTYHILSKLDVERLETLRFDYVFRLQKLYPSAFEQYKKANYLKYVHGTTAIEGNTFSLSETKQVLEDDVTVAGKSLREQHEVQNYKEVRQFIEETGGRFDLFFIKKLHKLICDNISTANPGKFRVFPVGIQGMDMDTSPTAAIETDLEDLILDYKKWRRNKLHVVEIAGIFHQRFEEIHPFLDGNGRVDRELINVILERGDFPPVYFEKKDRARYLETLEKGNPKDGITNEKFPIVQLLKDKLFENHEKILEEVKSVDLRNAEGLNEKNSVQKNIFEFINR